MMSVCARLFAAIVALALSAGPVAASTFTGKLWLLPNGGLVATLPAPTQTPDATFSTSHVAFFASAPVPGVAVANLNNSVGAFLNSSNLVSNFATRKPGLKSAFQ